MARPLKQKDFREKKKHYPLTVLENEGKWKDQVEDPFFALLDLVSSLEPVAVVSPTPLAFSLASHSGVSPLL